MSDYFNMMKGKDLYSTGNRNKDVGIGLMSALQTTFNKPQKYYVKANYMGNGLAHTGLGALDNPNYSNPYDYMNALSASMYEGENNEEQQGDDNNPYKQSLYNAFGKLSKLGGNIGDWAANQRGKILPNGKLAFGNMFQRVGDFTDSAQNIIPITDFPMG